MLNYKTNQYYVWRSIILTSLSKNDDQFLIRHRRPSTEKILSAIDSKFAAFDQLWNFFPFSSYNRSHYFLLFLFFGAQETPIWHGEFAHFVFQLEYYYFFWTFFRDWSQAVLFEFYLEHWRPSKLFQCVFWRRSSQSVRRNEKISGTAREYYSMLWFVSRKKQQQQLQKQLQSTITRIDQHRMNELIVRISLSYEIRSWWFSLKALLIDRLGMNERTQYNHWWIYYISGFLLFLANLREQFFCFWSILWLSFFFFLSVVPSMIIDGAYPFCVVFYWVAKLLFASSLFVLLIGSHRCRNRWPNLDWY